MTSKLGVTLPYTDNGNQNWRNIVIEEGEVQYNANGKPLYRQCEFSIPLKTGLRWIQYPKTVYDRCGADGMYLITRTSTLTGNTYTSYACEYCAKEWIAPNV